MAGYPVIYDYAHHPTEIAAGINAVRAMGNERVTVVFCPHTYSRTASLWDDFVRSLRLADRVILLDIFAAREAPVFGIDSRRLAAAIGENASYVESDARAIELALATPQGAIVLMGAGNLEGVRGFFKKNS
jgi:UDP-N-acetylmuramate--alanine ligase